MPYFLILIMKKSSPDDPNCADSVGICLLEVFKSGGELPMRNLCMQVQLRKKKRPKVDESGIKEPEMAKSPNWTGK